MMPSHTPGPWIADRSLDLKAIIIGAPTLVSLAVVRRLGPDIAIAEVEANARLIAAAPDLLASLQATWDALQACNDQELWNHLKPARDASLAALAKAKGGT